MACNVTMGSIKKDDKQQNKTKVKYSTLNKEGVGDEPVLVGPRHFY